MAEPKLNNADVAGGNSVNKTYGQILEEARESKGLSIEQVASQLRLAPKQIAGLENCDNKVFASVVYTRAHLRSYARLLGLKEDDIVRLFNSTLGKEDRSQQNFIDSTTTVVVPKIDSAKNVKAKGLGWIVFLIILLLVGFMAWNYAGDSVDVKYIKEKIAALTSSSDQQPAQEEKKPVTPLESSQQAPAEQAAAEPAKQEPAQEQVEAKPEASAGAEQATDANGQNMIGKTPEEKALEEKIMAEQTRIAEEQKAKEEEAARVQAEKAAEEARLQAAKNPLALTQGANGGWETKITNPAEENTLKLSAVDGDCWFGVYHDGKLINSVTLKNGESREFSIGLPARLTVGNRFRAAVEVNGRPVELSNGSRSGSVSFYIRGE